MVNLFKSKHIECDECLFSLFTVITMRLDDDGLFLHVYLDFFSYWLGPALWYT